MLDALTVIATLAILAALRPARRQRSAAEGESFPTPFRYGLAGWREVLRRF
ncbi:MAG: hypothetical protein ACE5JR_12150 [Gemmatimonadota bacterium]